MALTIKTIELKKLKPYEKNTRIHTEEQTRELAKRLEKSKSRERKRTARVFERGVKKEWFKWGRGL